MAEIPDRYSRLQTENVKLQMENRQLRDGLTIIAEGAAIYGTGWCIAQAIGHRDDLDFDMFPENGKSA